MIVIRYLILTKVVYLNVLMIVTLVVLHLSFSLTQSTMTVFYLPNAQQTRTENTTPLTTTQAYAYNTVQHHNTPLIKLMMSLLLVKVAFVLWIVIVRILHKSYIILKIVILKKDADVLKHLNALITN